VSSITTLAAGNTTITGFANVSFGSGGGITGPGSGSWAGKFVTNQDTTAYNGISVQNRWAAAASIIFEGAMGWNGTAVGYYPVFTIDGLGQVTINTNAPQTFVMGTYANGNIGFGNTAPAHKISVNGTTFLGGVTTHNANVAMANNNIINPILTGYTETEVANTATTGSWTMNCGAANFFDLTLTGNITVAPSNVPANCRVWSGTIAAKQDATGGRTITWPAGIKWPGGSAPPATTTANATDIWSLMTYDGGTTWVGSLSVKNVA
jgi:hypothetical protein